MEGIHNTTFKDSEEAEDTLSLRDLQINDYGINSFQNSPRTSSAQELFEFFTGLGSESAFPGIDQINFCGKTIREEELNEYQKRDYLSLIRSDSFHKTDPIYGQLDDERDRFVTNTRSSSVRFSGSDTHPYPSKCSPRVQKVNITSLTSMSAKSKRRMFMFGPVKFKPEMELSAIRKRQSVRSPAPMFPSSNGGELVSGGGVRGKDHWRLLKTLRCRAHLTTALARSFGCIPCT